MEKPKVPKFCGKCGQKLNVEKKELERFDTQTGKKAFISLYMCPTEECEHTGFWHDDELVWDKPPRWSFDFFPQYTRTCKRCGRQTREQLI